MFRSKFLNILMSLLVIASMTLGETGQQVVAQSQSKAPPAQQASGGNLHGKVTPAERQAAAERLKAAYKQTGISTQAAGVMNAGGVPDYFGTTPTMPTAHSRHWMRWATRWPAPVSVNSWIPCRD